MFSQSQQYTVSQSQGSRPVCAAVWSFDPGQTRVLVEEQLA